MPSFVRAKEPLHKYSQAPSKRCLHLWHTGPPRSELQGVDHDCNDIPDAAMTLAVAALFAKGSTRIRNVYNWRVKACPPPPCLPWNCC